MMPSKAIEHHQPGGCWRQCLDLTCYRLARWITSSVCRCVRCRI